jgi:hypothetical protein
MYIYIYILLAASDDGMSDEDGPIGRELQDLATEMTVTATNSGAPTRGVTTAATSKQWTAQAKDGARLAIQDETSPHRGSGGVKTRKSVYAQPDPQRERVMPLSAKEAEAAERFARVGCMRL